MQHDIQDAYDARRRAQSGSAAAWHPILAAVELEPGHWQMVAQYDRAYGEIRIVRRGDELGYRAENSAGELVGYFTSLRAAAAAAHIAFVQSHARAGGINGH